jgi:uncharacterized membrane protein
MDSRCRSIVKAVTWRIGGTFVTILTAWLLTGRPTLSVGIGLLDSAVKIGAFYIHERVWDRLSFGRPKSPEYQI